MTSSIIFLLPWLLITHVWPDLLIKNLSLKLTFAHLLRYFSVLAGFDYTVKFNKLGDNQNVNCLSWAPIKQYNFSSDMARRKLIVSDHLVSSKYRLRTWHQMDEELWKMKQKIQTKLVDSDYIWNCRVLFTNNRVMIPKSPQSEVLKNFARHILEQRRND